MALMPRVPGTSRVPGATSTPALPLPALPDSICSLPTACSMAPLWEPNMNNKKD